MKTWPLILIAVGVLAYPAFFRSDAGTVAKYEATPASDAASATQQQDGCLLQLEAPTADGQDGPDEPAAGDEAAPPGEVMLESIDYGPKALGVLNALAQRGALVVKGEMGNDAFQPTHQFDFKSWNWRAVPDENAFEDGELRLITEQAARLPQPGTTVLHLPEELRAQLVRSSEGGLTRLELKVDGGGELRVVTRTATQTEGTAHLL